MEEPEAVSFQWRYLPTDSQIVTRNMPEKYYLRAILTLCHPITSPSIPNNYYHTQEAKEVHLAEKCP
ncbi:hypothetical protein [Klebsiella variicola]|uniref:hypothetical protein n=1 Tax=Klebsiella variicola TaxID=244366 RepID=UPI001C27E1D7|nr:hypothetical protein [Klebsiella variicola]